MLQETAILAKLLPQLPGGADVLVGPGDDCAVVSLGGNSLLLAADSVTEMIHFVPDTAPEAAGAKLMNRNLSDIAAMGGEPKWALLSVLANGKTPDYVVKFCRGAASAGEKFGVPVVGGDVSGLPQTGFSASLTIIGVLPPDSHPILRSTAKVGELLYVTGVIGNSFGSGHHLDFTPRLAESRLIRQFAGAMLDVSDGLLLDARRLAASSQVDLELDLNAVPLRSGATAPGAFADGEDYELLFTAFPGWENTYPAQLAPITCIGRVVPGTGRLRDTAGNLLNWQGKYGYEH